MFLLVCFAEINGAWLWLRGEVSNRKLEEGEKEVWGTEGTKTSVSLTVICVSAELRELPAAGSL